MSDILEKLNSVFPDSEVFESIEGVLKARQEVELKHDIQPLYCNYHGRLRVVEYPVCQLHLEAFEPWCWEKCKTEFAIRRLRPALDSAYREHKSESRIAQRPSSPSMSGVPEGLLGELYGKAD